ncbi:nitric oxide-associated protein 1 [Scaptodrosophila lebanonensis]|uniref:Nitric oxide-associated protein 1 n=1 Tax=Drosophila lebanonensis TaxID=7225 RepID=A0A6J2U7D6_DROLE|nr:nitric oxide-associated protein 1 [Scaptodrosophila lebanonensis]
MLKTFRLTKTIKKSIYVCARLQTAMASESQSARQKAFQAAKHRYANYEHVHHSSFLEVQVGPLNDFRQRKIAYPSLEELCHVQHDETLSDSTYPDNWMEDYEFYEGAKDELGNVDSKHGTPDRTVPPSKVPCNGCGAHLHCANSSLPGYIPSEIFRGRSQTELQTITCQRCHFLKHYNIALDVEIEPSSYVETISQIKDRFALAIVIVDVLDMFIWPNMQELLGNKRPVFIIGNKVDLLPRDSNKYLEHVKKCLLQQFTERCGFDALNIKNVSLISAKTGYGIEELITQLHKIWQYKGDVYLLGCTNVGKSTLFNILLNSDYCRPEASELIRKATACPWPGTTLQLLKFPILRPSDLRVYQRYQRLFAERTQRAALDKLRRDQVRETGAVTAAQLIGQVGRTFEQRHDVTDAFSMAAGTQPITTLNEKKREYREARWVYDTPGVMQPDQLTPLLTTEELLLLHPTKMIRPRAYRLRSSMTLFLAGLARIDLLSCQSKNADLDWLKVFVFASPNLPVLIADTEQADSVYHRYLGTPLLGIPRNDNNEMRLERWPGLKPKNEDIFLKSNLEHGNIKGGERKLNCDITLSSAGWLGLLLPESAECTVRVWTPHARGIYVREPALIPLADRLVGKHIRNSLAYNTSKPFVFRK